MQKILIIRFSSIGDIVLTSPVMRCLKEQLQQVEIHYMTKKAFAPILEANPHVDQVFTIDKEENPLKSVAHQLQQENYTLIIDLHKNLRSWYLRYKLGVKTVVFDKINLQKWLLTTFKINKMPDLHIVDRYLQTVQPLGIQNDEKGLDYFIPSSDYLVPQHYDARLKTGQFIVFVIGAAHATKRMPAKKMQAICAELKDELIVLIGGKADISTGKILETAGDHVINLCGQFNLHQSASLVDQAKVVLAHDTGFMHIAAARKKQIVSVWGNTVPEFGMYPYLPKDAPQHQIIEDKSVSCRPCSKIGHKTCPKKHFNCMNNLDNATIIAALKTNN